MKRKPIAEYGYRFIEDSQIPEGADEYYLRDQQISGEQYQWRHLNSSEILALEEQGNISPNWNDVLIEDPFDISLLRGNSFFGLVRIGSMEPYAISYHDFALPEGIRDSHIISSDIGRHCAIHRCAYISHYIVRENCILSEIDEMDATNHAKFGNGVLTEGEDESVRIWLSIMNEAEGRAVLPFDSMICADAWLWATYREKSRFIKSLEGMTNRVQDLRRGWYATVGTGSVIKTCRVIKDVKFGDYSYVKGANKLKNLTIHSCEKCPSQIGEGVELVNGIIGYGCHVFYGVKAVRFIMGNNSNLKYGARLLNSVLGDNSTISCCEVLNTLVFPFHEQHHNNSFLIAALVMGQSNMAAGANIGSNHNTRGNDGELRARRGFWPALSSSIKYNSNFASFTLITKGDYPNELNISLPFSMVSYNEHEKCLTVMPAYWWLYNRYALERNGWKFRTRDKRKRVVQHIESDYLAPDTMEEIESALDLLRLWVGNAALAAGLLKPADVSTESDLKAQGQHLLEEQMNQVISLKVIAKGIERSSTPTRILKAAEGYRAYQEMLVFACMRILLQYMETHADYLNIGLLEKDLDAWVSSSPEAMDAITGPFVNMGGQIVSERQVNSLIGQVEDGKIDSWEAMHAQYDAWWTIYPRAKTAYALKTLRRIVGCEVLNARKWGQLIDRFCTLADQNALEVLKSRKKDHEEAFRKSTYRNDEEMLMVLGKAEDNQFIKESRIQMDALKVLAQRFSLSF